MPNLNRYNMSEFAGAYDTTLKVGWNHLDGGEAVNNPEQDWLFVKSTDGGSHTFVTLPRDAAVALRDHLNDLLGETESVTDATAPDNDRAVAAMEELAHQMSVFYNSELSDALNRHADVMSKVHNL